MNFVPSLTTQDNIILVQKILIKSQDGSHEINYLDYNVSPPPSSPLLPQEFKECLVRIATLSQFKLGGLKGTDEEIQKKELELFPKAAAAKQKGNVVKAKD